MAPSLEIAVAYYCCYVFAMRAAMANYVWVHFFVSHNPLTKNQLSLTSPSPMATTACAVMIARRIYVLPFLDAYRERVLQRWSSMPSRYSRKTIKTTRESWLTRYHLDISIKCCSNLTPRWRTDHFRSPVSSVPKFVILGLELGILLPLLLFANIISV